MEQPSREKISLSINIFKSREDAILEAMLLLSTRHV